MSQDLPEPLRTVRGERPSLPRGFERVDRLVYVDDDTSPELDTAAAAAARVVAPRVSSPVIPEHVAPWEPDVDPAVIARLGDDPVLALRRAVRRRTVRRVQLALLVTVPLLLVAASLLLAVHLAAPAAR